MIFLRRFLFKMIRVIVIFLSFTLDIKVRADVTVRSTEGKYEIEKEGHVVPPELFKTMAEPLSLETFSGGTTKFFFNSAYIGLGENTYVDISPASEMILYNGKIYADVTDTSPLKISTNHLSLSAEKARFCAEVQKNKTILTVISGQVILKDRASGKSEVISPGYTVWVGGLLATGEHSFGNLEALPFVETMKNIRELSLLSNVDIQAQSDSLRPLWKKAVNAVAEKNQTALASDIKKLTDEEQGRQVFEKRRAKEEADLRRYFRAKTLGIPNEDLDNQSEPTRQPASN